MWRVRFGAEKSHTKDVRKDGVFHPEVVKLTAWRERAVQEASIGRSEVVFRLAGTYVGNGVVAGTRVLNFGVACGRRTKGWCRSSLSGVGRMCSWPFQLKDWKRARRVAEPSEVAAPVETVAALYIPIDVGQEPEAIVTFQPQAEPARTAEVSPAEVPAQPAITETEKIVSAPVARPKSEAKKARPRGRSRAQRPTFPELTAEQVEAAEFCGAAQKVLFRKALSDLKEGGIAMRARAAETLGRIPHELSVRALATHLSGEPSARVRKACINALIKLNLNEGIPSVKHALGDSDEGVRLAAVMGVYRLAGVACASTLIGMLRDENAEVRSMVARCIGWMEVEHLAVELIPLLSDKAVQVRRAAVEAMGNLGERRVVPVLIECLSDADGSVRRRALKAIEGITGQKMGERRPQDKEEHERQLARWRHWWKGQADR